VEDKGALAEAGGGRPARRRLHHQLRGRRKKKGKPPELKEFRPCDIIPTILDSRPAHEEVTALNRLERGGKICVLIFVQIKSPWAGRAPSLSTRGDLVKQTRGGSTTARGKRPSKGA